MAKLNADALTPEVIAGLEVSIADFFDQWKQSLLTTWDAVNSFTKMINAFEREDREMMQRWENEGGSVYV